MKTTIFWFRRDLRLEDNAGLYHALRNSNCPVQPIFIFDTTILDRLSRKKDPRVEFIHKELTRLNNELSAVGSSIRVYHGNPIEIWEEILDDFEVQSVYLNKDYEPSAKERDRAVQNRLIDKDIQFYSWKDHVIFEGSEILKTDGTPYVVYSPYRKSWYERLHRASSEENISFYFKSYPTLQYYSNFARTDFTIPKLSDIGFEQSDIQVPDREVNQKKIKEYDKTRNFPAINGTSRLGVHFRFGTISIREKARKAYLLNKTYLSELIWRDFYAQILDHFPHVVDNAFRAKYDQIEWRNNEEEFDLWKQGKTGYPIVDAGMRELVQTGYMHNRVRMITASFLTKHLLIDWRWGESFFAEHLLDFELASNNGGWQWASGSGTDAAPYFRVFNPTLQQQKFDKHFAYIQHYVPEYGTADYTDPIVDHKFARNRCLEVYKEAINRN